MPKCGAGGGGTGIAVSFGWLSATSTAEGDHPCWRSMLCIWVSVAPVFLADEINSSRPLLAMNQA